jgi:hypothetical protein
MAGFLYWFPDVAGMIDSPVKFPLNCKLLHLAGASLECGQQANGPDVNRTGAMVTVAPAAGSDGKQAVCRFAPSGDAYVPDGQNWRPVGPAEKPDYWIGWERGGPPRPADLARTRPSKLRGYDVTLGDGNLWKLPVLRGGFITVPTVFRSLPGGEVNAEVVEAYADLCHEAEAWMEKSQKAADWKPESEDPQPTFLHKDILSFCTAVIGVNYRVGLAEVSALGLVRNDTWEDVVGAAIGGLAIEEELAARKKNGTRSDG